MTARRFYLLIAATVLALVIAMAIQRSRQPESDPGANAPPLLPQLRNRVNDVTAITLTGANAEVLVTLKRGSDGWSIAEKSGYPAEVARIRELLLRLDQATLIEPKTTNPARYAELGVDDVKSQDAKGLRIDIAGLPQPASLIVGVYNGEVGTLVRREGDAQVWLASGDLTVARNVADWEKRNLADIAAGRLKSVTLTAPDGKKALLYKEHPDDANFRLAEVPKGRQPGTAYVFNATMSALAGLKADDVYPAKDVAAPEKTYKAVYAAFDGLVVTAIAWQEDGNNYGQFKAALDPTAANAQIAADLPEAPAKDRQDKLAALNKEVDALNQAFSGWTFVLSAVRFSNFRKSLDELLLALPEKTPGATDAHASAANAPPKPAAK